MNKLIDRLLGRKKPSLEGVDLDYPSLRLKDDRMALRLKKIADYDFPAHIEQRFLASGRSDIQFRAAMFGFRVYFMLILLNEQKDKQSGHQVSVEMVDDLADEFWHLFLLDTRGYAAFCHEVIGHFVHHVPYTEKKPFEDQKIMDQFNELKSVLNKVARPLAYRLDTEAQVVSGHGVGSRYARIVLSTRFAQHQPSGQAPIGLTGSLRSVCPKTESRVSQVKKRTDPVDDDGVVAAVLTSLPNNNDTGSHGTGGGSPGHHASCGHSTSSCGHSAPSCGSSCSS